MGFKGISNRFSNRFSNLRGSIVNSLTNSVPLMVLLSFGLLASTSALAVDNIQNGYAGADAGDWGGKNGAVIGPADDTCANMGAVGKVNLVSNFGFNIPLAATITELRAFTKAGAGSPQSVGVQLATDATIDPPVIIGSEVLFPFPDVGSGNCAATIVSDVGNGLGFWDVLSLAPVDVNSPAFGMVFTKQETSEIKVDSICMQIGYETDDGPAVVEECFAVVLPSNTITVVKDVVGAPPAGEWAYTGTLGAFSLPAGGGFETFTELNDGSYTITETPKDGYTVTSECLIGGEVVSSGAASVSVDVADDVMATCIFTNTQDPGSFTVVKDFSDDNAAVVDMTLACTSGTVTVNPLGASEGSPAVFEVTGFLPGTTCTATEAATPGYTQVTADCENGDPIDGSCTMTNNLNVGAFTVIKDFSDDNAAVVDMTLACTSGTVTANPLGASEGSPAVFEVTGFLPGATCTAAEAATPGYTQVTADCEDDDPIGGSCTMTNNLNVGAFTVIKDFSDDNAAVVDMTLACTSGTVTANPLGASEGSPAVFEVTGFLPGATCTAAEAATPGYTQVTTDCEDDDPIDGSCTMTNNLNVGAFTVSKDFSDDSDASVDMTLTCSTGTVTTNPVAATEGSPAVFEVTGFLPGATCTATEAAIPGYDQDDSACQADDLSADGGSCTMVNTLRTGAFTVSKDFSDDSDAVVDMTLSCTSGTVTVNPLGASEGSPAVFEVTGFLLDATCTATEAATPGYDQDDSACQADDLSADGGSCTMVNTVFFEGIPTLNQYGMALLALLMLGIGAVGFRRFA